MPDPRVELSAEQKHILTLVSNGKNLFITGPGGTGKSTVIEAIKEKLASSRKKFFVTAPTGIAALNIGGCTIHSFAGVGLANGSQEDLLKDVMKRRKNVTWWLTTDTLIIDEVSMLSPKLFEKLEFIARQIRNNEKFFGGIQLIAVGDFFQLPPVDKQTKEEKADPKYLTFVFEHPLWNKNMRDHVMLTKVHRQKDIEFIQMLSEVRQGRLSNGGEDLLRSRLNAKLACPNGILPTRLFPTRAEADDTNRIEMAALPGQARHFKRTQSSIGTMTAAQRDYMWKKLDENCRIDIDLELKVGAQVMLLANINVSEGLVNGSRGVVLEFNEMSGWPVVLFADGQRFEVEPWTWTEMAPDRKSGVSNKQVPLKLAYGITIHKSQGLTIDLLSICLTKTFEYGQGYVALSRARTLEGLALEGDFDTSMFAPHPKVLAFYSTLGKLIHNPEDDIPMVRRMMVPKIPPRIVSKSDLQKAKQLHLVLSNEPVVEKKEELPRSAECIICLSEKSTHIVLPCGHKCLCLGCSLGSGLKNCPLCRKDVDNIIKVFE